MKTRSRLLVLTALMAASALSLGLATGDPAPDFAAKNQDGKEIRLSALRGKPVLVYFYPKDDTPGCTKEACTFRDEYTRFQKMGAVILGVSRQDAKSHQAFREKYHLPFDLLSDTDGKVAKALGVDTMLIGGYHKRQSVLISADGKIIQFYPDVNPATHTAQVLQDLQNYALKAGKMSAG
jgi:peroxiredoxin Q/BCP